MLSVGRLIRATMNDTLKKCIIIRQKLQSTIFIFKLNKSTLKISKDMFVTFKKNLNTRIQINLRDISSKTKKQ